MQGQWSVFWASRVNYFDAFQCDVEWVINQGNEENGERALTHSLNKESEVKALLISLDSSANIQSLRRFANFDGSC